MLDCSTKYKISQSYSHLLKINRPTKLVQVGCVLCNFDFSECNPCRLVTIWVEKLQLKYRKPFVISKVKYHTVVR